MSIIRALILKEFLQIKRNPIILKILFLIPIVQLILIVYAANFEIKEVTLGVVDFDRSGISQQYIEKIQASGYFKLKSYYSHQSIAQKALHDDQIDLYLEIPSNFEKELIRGEKPQIGSTIQAINGMKAGIISSYLGTITQQFIQDKSKTTPIIQIESRNWFNPKLDYKSLMLPGVLCILITLIGILITALNIVQEKEKGTIEQLNVTPIKKWQFILGKLIPYGIISMAQLTLGLILSVVIFDLQIEGSIALLYFVVLIYMIGVLGIGFLISTIADTQAQAMFVTLFLLFIFILLSGLFTPIDSMPLWAQYLNKLNPTAYLMEIVRLIILKGSSWQDIQTYLIPISLFALSINLIVIWRYRKVS